MYTYLTIPQSIPYLQNRFILNLKSEKITVLFTPYQLFKPLNAHRTETQHNERFRPIDPMKNILVLLTIYPVSYRSIVLNPTPECIIFKWDRKGWTVEKRDLKHRSHRKSIDV